MCVTLPTAPAGSSSSLLAPESPSPRAPVPITQQRSDRRLRERSGMTPELGRRSLVGARGDTIRADDPGVRRALGPDRVESVLHIVGGGARGCAWRGRDDLDIYRWPNVRPEDEPRQEVRCHPADRADPRVGFERSAQPARTDHASRSPPAKLHRHPPDKVAADDAHRPGIPKSVGVVAWASVPE